MAYTVLIVCSGNTCRSPMAEALLRRQIERAGDAPRLRVASAGTWGPSDAPAAALSQQLLAQEGLDLSAHRSRLLTQRELDDADLILVMTRTHKEDITQRFARAADKLYLFSEMIGKRDDIADPHGGELADYQACKKALEEIVTTGYARIVSLALGQERNRRR